MGCLFSQPRLSQRQLEEMIANYYDRSEERLARRRRRVSLDSQERHRQTQVARHRQTDDGGYYRNHQRAASPDHEENVYDRCEQCGGGRFHTKLPMREIRGPPVPVIVLNEDPARPEMPRYYQQPLYTSNPNPGIQQPQPVSQGHTELPQRYNDLLNAAKDQLLQKAAQEREIHEWVGRAENIVRQGFAGQGAPRS